jgi:hypothetical protein
VLLPIYGPLALGVALMLIGLYFIHKDEL